ncbi:dienelactone hydrolase [Streptomyces nigrescens]|uniref:Dienelactone hydrolase n=2 Tax=Streptomyces TaxID=1883 RepID=A0ABM7ZNH4_STRNI|nr:dienelactone hydrolase family protein [Streptomyces nigrescens]MEE4423986.1 dienelactone hydrolase family protein [Streptomyces sp. DSM 41528]BDM67942.1 dienelactone hydrolase [Streptomyces nigrescens]
MPASSEPATSGVPTIVLFHSVCGLRPAVHAAADRLRAAGHEVIVPDLFDGRTADSVPDGILIKDEIGKEELLKRAITAVAPYSDRGLVYAGFSFGGAVAQNLALGDEKARGLLLMHGTSDIAEGTAVDELPVQLHVADPDPFEPHDWLTAWYLQMRRAGADVEVFRYAGAGHLFTDPDLPDYDAEAAESAWKVALGFLAEL